MVNLRPIPHHYFATATFLATEKREKGSDPPIPIERAGDVWQNFEVLALKTVVRTLRRLPLGEICRQLRGRNLCLVRSPSIVREKLAEDQEHIRDLMQETALAMVHAINRGAIGAARPIVYVWIEKTAYRITREKSRAAALSLLTGAYLSDDNGDEESRSPEPPPLAGLTGRPLAEAEELEDVLDVRTQLKELMFSSIPANLTDGQELVFTRRLEGASHHEIADELGISEGAVRLRLHQARKRLAA